MGMSAIDWGSDCTPFKLSRKPGVAGLNCGGGQYNKHSFTLLCVLSQQVECLACDCWT